MPTYILQKNTPTPNAGCIFESVYNGAVYICLDKPHESFAKEVVENNPDWFKLYEQKEKIKYSISIEYCKSNWLYNTSTVGQCYHKEIPIHKYELVKSAIEKVLNNKTE